jgi:hypothetical protein
MEPTERTRPLFCSVVEPDGAWLHVVSLLI